MEEKVKQRLPRILCLLCAVALWLYVTYTEDPEMQVWMRGIPVTYHGASTLSESGITFTYTEEPEEINVKLSGRRSALRRVMENDVHASVDYSSIQSQGKHTLPIHVSLSQGDLRVAKLSQTNVTCVTDILVTVDKTVSVTTTGAEPLGMRDFAASPSTVRVTGPKSTLEHLKASVYIDLTKENVTNEQTVMLIGQSGKEEMPVGVSVENPTISVSATRALPIVIEATEKPENISEVVCEPETASVRGTLEALLAAENVRGAYSVWVDFSASPATSGPVPLVYPEDVTVLGPASAKATFHTN